MANTTRIFMGTQIACAQCHDHPHDKWSQMAFFQMAAFTHNLKSFAQTQRFPSIRDKFDVDEMPEARRWERVDRWVRYEFLDAYIMGDGAGRIQLPNDYQYKDGKPREWVGARTMLGKKVQNRKEDKDLKNSRKRLGDWMISTENPNFTSVISNRMWKRAMGIGLVEPLDNFTENTKPSNPALLSFLDRLMVHIDFDLKLFQKIIYNSQTFGRDTNPEEVDTKQPYYFHGYALQRMSAEQIWDSMLALTIDDPDGPKRAYLGDQVIWNGKTVLKGMTMADLQKEVTSLKPDQYVKYIQDLSKRLKEGYKGKEEPMMMEMMVASGSTKGLRRASELPSPAPASHFLRTFGQSDREVIENSTRVGDVTQVLSLMNGHVQQHILNNDKAAIIVKVRESDDVDKRIETIFLSVLCRKPSEAEMEIMRKEVADRDFRGIENIIAALINSSEFIHIH
jgi:hypothetical protein